MVKANDSWPCEQHSAWNSPNLNYMSTLLQSGRQNGLPSCMNPSTFSSNVASPGIAVSGLPGLKTGQTNGAHGLFHFSPPRLESLLSTSYPYLKEKQPASSYGLGVKATPNAVYGSIQKRFLIFDQSRNQTRLILTSVCSPAQNPIIAPTKPVCACDLLDEKQAANVEQIFPINPIIQEKSDENHMFEASEGHEDTEEINALLYSDDDDDDDDDSEDDEVTSTGHSPFAIEGSHERHEHVEEIASSDGPTKRHRLLDGGYKKSSLMDIASSVKLDRTCKYDDDAESSCVKGRTQEEGMGSILGNKRSRKDKIHETLRILESIIPGVKSTDPLLVIDEAINYLKLKAKALRIGYPRVPLQYVGLEGGMKGKQLVVPQEEFLN
uniref:BHLH domain-containing protein n=1 Tax=Davidia involucrata TaxID=16924 RepID=A0A5B7AI55_DAVIN